MCSRPHETTPADTLAHCPAVIRLSPEARGSKVVTSITGAPHRANGAKGAAQETGCNFPRVGLAGGTCVYGLPKQRNCQSQATCTSCSLRFIKLKSNCRPPLLSVSAMPTAELHAHVFSPHETPADTLAHCPAVIRLSPEARGSKVVTSITGAPHRANGAKGAAQETGCNFARVGLAGGTCVYGLPKQRNCQSQATCTSCSLHFTKLKSNCRPPLVSVSAMPTAELHAHVFSPHETTPSGHISS